MQSDFQQFQLIREQMSELAQLTNKEEWLSARVKQQEKRLIELEVELELEKEDVEKLTKMSLKSMFYTILRSKDEQLAKERREVLEATLRLQETKLSLDENKTELAEVNTKIAQLSTVPDQYNALIIRKELLLKSLPASALELEEMESEIADHSILLKELKEALKEGKVVVSLLNDASISLEKAEDWGNWDLWLNGGFISTHIKHSHIDDARVYIHNANRQLERFNKELEDLKQSVNIDIDISDILTIADYWFDGLIVDWIVQGKIENAQQKTLAALYKVTPVIKQLGKEVSNIEQKLEQLTKQRLHWIEEKQY